MGTPPTMLKVEMKANVDLLQRFDLERRNLARENGGDVNEVWLWHATSSEAAEKSILTAALGRAPREATARQDTGGPAHAQVQELSGRLPFAARRRHVRESLRPVIGEVARSTGWSDAEHPVLPQPRPCWLLIISLRRLSRVLNTLSSCSFEIKSSIFSLVPHRFLQSHLTRPRWMAKFGCSVASSCIRSESTKRQQRGQKTRGACSCCPFIIFDGEVGTHGAQVSRVGIHTVQGVARALACLVSHESELAFLLRSLIKRSPPPPPPAPLPAAGGFPVRVPNRRSGKSR